MTLATCWLTAKNRDQLRNRTLGNRVWATFTSTFKIMQSSVLLSAERYPKCCKVAISVSLSVCFYARISQKPRFQSLPTSLCMLPDAVAWFSSDRSTVLYVVPVLWMTLCFQIICIHCIYYRCAHRKHVSRRFMITTLSTAITDGCGVGHRDMSAVVFQKHADDNC